MQFTIDDIRDLDHQNLKAKIIAGDFPERAIA